MLGALLVGVGILAHVFIKSLSRISQLEKDKFENDFKLDNRIDSIFSHIADIKRELHNCDEQIINDYKQQFSNIDRRCDEILNVVSDSVESLEKTSIRDIHEYLDNLNRNVDSRFDKFDNKLETNKNETLRITSNMIDETIKRDLNELNKRFYELEAFQQSKKLIKG
jgi:hypothetical protein